MLSSRGWFEIPGFQTGKRKLAQQMLGLKPLWKEIAHRRSLGEPVSVLDLGCAEGLISAECAKRGAAPVTGVDFKNQFILQAQRLYRTPSTFFMQWDLRYRLDVTADVVLMLAVLHKMGDPGKLLREVLGESPSLVAIRLPARTEHVINDRRSGFVPFDVVECARDFGYSLEQVTRGHENEWCGWFRNAG